MLTQKQRVLLVDDEPDILTTIGKHLELEGFEVVRAVDGGEALTKATDETEPVDIIILDLMLPKRSGLQICQALRAHQRTSTVPIILYTGKGEEDVVASLGTDSALLREWGANAYVSKLAGAQGLIKKIRTLLRGVAP